MPDRPLGASDGGQRKRRRKVLSCYDCRRRKLQCDHAMPACGRCTKAGQAASCLYLEDASEVPLRQPEPGHTRNSSTDEAPFYGQPSRLFASSAPAGNLLSWLRYQDERIKQLEAALAQSSATPSGASSVVQLLQNSQLSHSPEPIVGTAEAVNTIQDRNMTLLRDNSFETRFHGGTHPGALNAHDPELRRFTIAIFKEFPALTRIRGDMRQLESRTKYSGGKSELSLMLS
jgi:hypothetical protein